MITGENKNKVDQIWDTFWSNGINNPLLVVEQISYLLFIKMLDDRQLKDEVVANTFGIPLTNPVFLQGDWKNPEREYDAPVPYEQLRWHVFRNLGSENMFRVVRDHVFTFIKYLGGNVDSAYARAIKDARLEISYPRILQKVVDQIEELNMDDLHAMGDVYEYILDRMAANGNSGQFRTPPHIIRMMVELMKPTPDDVICDPAMGTAGFLVESARYLTENHQAALMDEEVQKRFKTSLFNGFDTDPTMLRIAAMHMMLQGVDNPNFERRDSLSTDNNDKSHYTLCLANPPFAGSLDKENVHGEILKYANTRKTELLFIGVFLRSLQLGGRCASIVPDGVLFGNSNAHVSIRKELVENQKLQAVISMPSGVFQPYSGVSTAILIFTKTNSGGTDKVWFYDMTADGYTLDQKRTECKENDIPDVISRFNNLTEEENRTRKDKSFLVDVEDIRSNDYSLSINKYKEVEREVVEYEAPEVILERIQQLEDEISANLSEFYSKFLGV